MHIYIEMCIYVNLNLKPCQDDRESKEDNPRGLELLCLVDLGLSKTMKHETYIYIYMCIYTHMYIYIYIIHL